MYDSADIERFLNSPATDDIATWREWISKVLLKLEREVDGFSGKRPFGNSGWHVDLEVALAIVDPEIVLEGPTYDSDGYLERFRADKLRVAKAWDAVVAYMLQPKPATRTEFEDLLGSIWLYINWEYVTKQLTTEQKELFIQSVGNSSDRLDPDDEPLDRESYRWWAR